MPSPTSTARADRRNVLAFICNDTEIANASWGGPFFTPLSAIPCGELTGIWGAPILEFWGLRSEGDFGRGKSCHFECGADADWEIYGRAGAVVGDGIGREGGGGSGPPGRN